MPENLPSEIDPYQDIDKIDMLWNLTEDFCITDAAALVAGYNPVTIERCKSKPDFDHVAPKYTITLNALQQAIINGRLEATIRCPAREYGSADLLEDQEFSMANGYINTVHGFTADKDEFVSKDHTCFYKPFPDWSLSTVSRNDLVGWLRSREICTGFFFRGSNGIPEYLDSSHERYAPKLAAAVQAWLATSEKSSIKGKSAKQAITKWLREHAADYNLSDEEGKPNESGIEQCAKVANWQDKGGAPKTPSE